MQLVAWTTSHQLVPSEHGRQNQEGVVQELPEEHLKDLPGGSAAEGRRVGLGQQESAPVLDLRTEQQ